MLSEPDILTMKLWLFFWTTLSTSKAIEQLGLSHHRLTTCSADLELNELWSIVYLCTFSKITFVYSCHLHEIFQENVLSVVFPLNSYDLLDIFTFSPDLKNAPDKSIQQHELSPPKSLFHCDYCTFTWVNLICSVRKLFNLFLKRKFSFILCFHHRYTL